MKKILINLLFFAVFSCFASSLSYADNCSRYQMVPLNFPGEAQVAIVLDTIEGHMWAWSLTGETKGKRACGFRYLGKVYPTENIGEILNRFIIGEEDHPKTEFDKK